ncbi:MAG TPA: hypothetical protein VN962_20560 [Polyangia bacterium]|nr:hypothetical protein [Polyangia bacterium]
MERARVAGVIVVASIAAAAAIGVGRGWFRHPPAAGRDVAGAPEQKDLRNAAQAVELIARAAAEPPAKETPPPPAELAPAADSERPAPDVRWTARADASSKDGVLCGGKVCAANQFCCGPPECGRCASRLTGPRCPASCP